MKKLISLLLVAIMSFSLVSCGKKAEEQKAEKAKAEPVQLVLGTEYEVEDLKFTLRRVYINESIYGFTAGETYVDMVFDIVNTGGESVDCGEILALEANASGKVCEETFFGISSKTNENTEQKAVASGESARLHAAVSVPESEKTVTLKVKAGDEKFTYNYTINNDDKTVTPMAFDTETVVDGVGKFTITKVEATPKITPLMSGSGYTSSDGIYIDTVFDFTNTASTEISCDDIAEVTVKGKSGAIYDDCSVFVENKDRTKIDRYENVIPLATVKLHVAAVVQESEAEGELEFKIGGEFFSFSFDTSKETAKTVPLKTVGEVIGSDSTQKAEFVSCEFAEAVYPTNKDGYYSYYKVDDASNTYLALEFNVTNCSNTDKDVDEMLYAKAKFAGKYNYDGFCVSENDDKTSLRAYEQISPLATKRVIFLIEVPKTVMNESYVVDIGFDGTEYRLTVDKTAV